MRRSALKEDAREELMRGMQSAISRINGVNENSYLLEKRNEMIEQFRRVEKLLGFGPGTWKPFA